MRVPPALRALLINAAGSGLALILELVLARSMSSESYGEFRYIYSLAILIATFGIFGGGQRGVKLTARYAPGARLDKEIDSSICLAGVATIFSCIVGWALSCYSVIKVGEWSVYALLVIWIFFRVLFQLYRSFNVGLGNYMSAQLSDRFMLNGVPLLIAVVFFLLSINISLIYALVFSILGTAVAFALSYMAFQRARVSTVRGIVSVKALAARFSGGMYLALADGTEVFFRMGLILILASYLSFSEVAAYAVIFRLADALGMVQSAASAVFSRSIVSASREVGEKGRAMASLASHRFSMFCASFVFAAFICCCFFGADVLSLFGKGYAEYKFGLLITVGALCIKQAFGPSHLILASNGKEFSYFGITLFFAVLLSLFCGFFADKFGFDGAILCFGVLSICHGVVLALYCFKVIGFFPGIRVFPGRV